MSFNHHCVSPSYGEVARVAAWEESPLNFKLCGSVVTSDVNDILRQAAQWRAYSDRVRSMAASVNTGSKQHLLEVATRWAEMARTAEWLADAENDRW